MRGIPLWTFERNIHDKEQKKIPNGSIDYCISYYSLQRVRISIRVATGEFFEYYRSFVDISGDTRRNSTMFLSMLHNMCSIVLRAHTIVNSIRPEEQNYFSTNDLAFSSL